MKNLMCYLFCCLSIGALAQPATEVYIFDLQFGEGEMQIANPVNVSNHKGYDNQPHFLEDGSLLYVSSINGQTDVYHYSNGSSKQITATPGGEYSPTPTPDSEHFSTILLEPDGTQLLWQYNFDVKGNKPVLLAAGLKVGYHAWVSDHQIAAFVLGEPNTMQLIDVSTGQSQIIGESIGRSLHRIPGTDYFSYIQNDDTGNSEIRSYDLKTGISELLIRSVENSQDCAWTQNGTLIMGSGSKLFRWSKGMTEWKLIADISSFNLDGITRLAVNKDMSKIALVVSEN